MELSERVKTLFTESMQTKANSMEMLCDNIAQAGMQLTQGLLSSNKILACGNGGSASEAQHLAANLINRFQADRPSLPAIALSADTAILTSIANDYHYSEIFAKQIKAFGQPGDILVAISTSGNSENILSAIQAAHARQLHIIALTGRNGGAVAESLLENDLEIRVPSDNTARIQETHRLIIHCFCDIIEHMLFATA